MNENCKEEWKDIVGYEGLYQVSNLGNVKSLDRIDRIGRHIPEIILAQSNTTSGYLSVNLSKGRHCKTISSASFSCNCFY